jgi:hypothetical protein
VERLPDFHLDPSGRASAEPGASEWGPAPATADPGAAAAQRNAALDDHLESLNARFTDTSIALEYDSARVQERFGGEQKAETPEKVQHCLGERAHWIDCQTKYAVDSRPCNEYLSAFEKCVNKTIVDSTAEYTLK